jgi:hypothetical protein
MVIPSTGYDEQMQRVSSVGAQLSEIDKELLRRGRERVSQVTLNCAQQGCGATITLRRDDEQRLRQTHEMFYGINGHANYKVGLGPFNRISPRLNPDDLALLLARCLARNGVTP